MSNVEHVVGAFFPFGETADPSFCAQGVEPVPSARDQLVGVRLVPHVPDDLVLGHPENVVQGQSQFHSTEVRRQVTTVG